MDVFMPFGVAGSGMSRLMPGPRAIGGLRREYRRKWDIACRYRRGVLIILLSRSGYPRIWGAVEGDFAQQAEVKAEQRERSVCRCRERGAVSVHS